MWTRVYEAFANVAGRAVLGRPVEDIAAAVAAINAANQTLVEDPAWTKHQLP